MIPSIQSELSRHVGESYRPVNYVTRGDEKEWLTTLSCRNALLLSGPPRCGKSNAAAWIASELQIQGYNVRRGTDVEEARRYLQDPTPGERLYLLDDPLGSVRVDVNANHAVSVLKSVTTQLPPNRKLIVAQSQDQIFATTNGRTLGDCRLGNHIWHDLGRPKKSFLLEAWRVIATSGNVPALVRKAVSVSIEHGEALEVGNLSHLAANVDQLLPNASTQDIIRKAREDAADLGRELSLRGPDMHSLLLALSVGTSPGEPIQLRELAFLTDPQPAKLPCKNEDASQSVVTGDAVEDERPPDYENPPQPSLDILRHLDELEHRRFVSRGGDGINFRHPLYRAAAESVLAKQTALSASMPVKTLERALFCANARTSRAGARNLDWLYASLYWNPESQAEVVRYAIEGLKCVFPATRDLCFSFLIRHQEAPVIAKGKDLAEWVSTALSISLDNIRWYEGEAWVPPVRVFRGFPSFLDMAIVEASNCQQDLSALDGNLPATLSAERASRVIAFLGREPSAMSSRVALRLLSYDEAVLRAEAAETWLTLPRTDDNEVLSRIFEDIDPRVLLSAYKGLIRSWTILGDDRTPEHCGQAC